MAVRKIIAKKGSRTRQFNETEWALLGKNKNGWEQISDITVDNTIKPVTGEKKAIAPPATGGKKGAPDEIVVTNSVKDGKPDETKNNPDEISVENSVNENTTEITEEKKAEFMLSLEGLTKNTIKDFFDNQSPAIKYDNKSNLQAFKDQLADHFKYDLVAKQKAFSK